MWLMTLVPLAIAVSQAGGLCFLAVGTNVSDLKDKL